MQSLRSCLLSTKTRPWPHRPIRLTLVITDLDVGGAERAMVELATRLDRDRWCPSVICLGPEAELAGPLRSNGIAVECLSVSRRSPLRAISKVAGAIRSNKPEIVQSFLFHANIASKVAGLFAGRPRVLGGIRVAERRNRWHLGLERLTQRLSCGSICVSQGVREHAVRSGQLDGDRLAVIPNGIDAARFNATASTVSLDAIQSNERVMLFVGRLEPQKGVPTLIDAFVGVAEEFPGWALALVGEGPDRELLAAQATSHKALTGRIHFLGRRSDVASLMKRADVFVLPSLWEGMPNVVLEAMAAGKPVIGTTVEGTEELVFGADPGRTGWLVTPGSVSELADALRSAMKDPVGLAAIGLAGRNRIESNYSLDRVVRGYETLWAACLGLDRIDLDPPERFGFKDAPLSSR